MRADGDHRNFRPGNRTWRNWRKWRQCKTVQQPHYKKSHFEKLENFYYNLLIKTGKPLIAFEIKN